jgi:TonB-linked SusC/RagA family outer membrane protein
MGYYTPATYDYVQNTSAKTIRNTYNAFLTYEKGFNDHGLKAMVGTNIEDSEYKYISARRNGVYDFDKGEIKLAGGDQIASSSHTWWSIAGVFARLNYSFKNKYLLEVNGRFDGTSKFASGRRSGFFPSASAGWNISEEPWMDALKGVLSSAKLRASYGEVGNQDVPLNRYIATYPIINPTASDNEHWLIKNAHVPYIRDRNTYAATSPALTDPSLTWETVSTLDFGLDAGLFGDKLGIVVDWYSRKTTDMLTDGEVLPATVGADPALRNFGELTTKGIEITLNYRHAFDNGIKLNLSGNFTDYRTEITKFPTGPETLLTASYYEGKYTGDIVGFKTEGLYQREDFVWNEDGTIRPYTDETKVIRNTLAEGVPNQYALETTPNSFKFGPGDVRYADLNGDGVISLGNSTLDNPGDRTVIGNSTPRYQYGFRIGAEWKGFDLGLFFQGVGKREIWATGNMVLPGYVGTEGNFTHTLDYWSTDNTGAFYPRPVNHGNTANRWNYWPTDRYMLNGAYLRMKNLTVGYSIPTALVNKISVQRLRIYFSGENLFEFDKMGDVPIDPEIDWTLSNLNDARTFGRTYPYRRVLSFGLQLQF